MARNVPFMKRIYEKKTGVDGKEKMIEKWQIARKDIDGIPVGKKYKYLGTYF